MPKAELLKSLEDLRAEIEILAVDKTEIKDHMNALITDLESGIENLEGLKPKHRAALLERLRDGLKLSEVEHPTITAILNRIMVVLSNMGV